MSAGSTQAYQPSGNSYVYSGNYNNTQLQPQASDDAAIKIIESHGKSSTYPGEYCMQVVFGQVEIAVNNVIHFNVSSGNYFTYQSWEGRTYDLATPVLTDYGAVSKFNKGQKYEFGNQVAGQPSSYLEFDGTNIKWYTNNELVATDTLANSVNTFAIAVQTQATSITGYAYLYMKDGEIYTSGGKSNAEVLKILNTAGVIDETSKYGFTAEGKENAFVYSLIKERGHANEYVDGYQNIAYYISGHPSVDDLNSSMADAISEAYGGYLGTDVIEYLTGYSGSAGWSALMSEDFTEVIIPGRTEGTTYRLRYQNDRDDEHNLDANKFYILNDDLTSVVSSLTTSSHERGSNGRVYITWYKQSQPFTSLERLVWCHVIWTSGASVDPQYQLYSLSGEALFDDELVDPSQLEFIDDTTGGGQDEQQEDDEHEGAEEPSYDPLGGAGFLYAYDVDNADLQSLRECLNPDTFAETLRTDFGNNLYNFIVSIHLMPCTTNSSGTRKSIIYRNTPFKINDGQVLTLKPISKTWYSVDCGFRTCLPVVNRNNGFENWQSAQVQLYLPFIGTVNLNTGDVWGQNIGIRYWFDILNGTCTVEVSRGSYNDVLYTYAGSCKYSIPFTSTIDSSVQNVLSGLSSSINAGVSVAGAVISGSPSAALGAVGSGVSAVGSFAAATQHQATISRGGSLTANTGWNAPRRPALYITVPDVVSASAEYKNTSGYPCCIGGIIANWKNNYIEVMSADLKGIPATAEEISMIDDCLKGGVYV